MPDEISIGGVCRLADRGVIRARGADAATFLQGQLTNDVANLASGSARLAGFCSAKGRLQASFIVWRVAADEFLLSCPTSVLAPTLKRLSMFVLRAKCKLSDASDEVALLGVVGPAAAAILGDATVWQLRPLGAASVIRVADGAGLRRAFVAAPIGGEADVAAAPAMTLANWHWLEVESGIVTVEAATVDRFVPQMVNFELVGGVDFQKGCYPGQEVVARSQYRGTTKRRTFLFDCDAVPTAGADVYAAGAASEPAGTVANAAPHPEHPGGSALVEVRLAALSADLRLGALDGPRLRQRALPYPVPLDVAASA
ncbi:MAG: folate-binding protein [Pseudomonadota bacterium]|nr:folate-binding protein [Pseudomonadota bacterium]